MIHRNRTICLFAALLAVAGIACGKSGSRETRPIEVIYRASGVTGTRFRMRPEAPTDCTGSGIRGSNGDHQFPLRIFEAPHFFILENLSQPVSATFEVLPDETNPLRVDLFLGTDLRATTSRDITPGSCADVKTGDPIPDVAGHRVRIEICATTSTFPPGASCGDFPDAFVAFFASLGDQFNTNVTSCDIRPVAEACRTPATLFIEDARETVSAAFDPLGTENRDAVFRVELYVDDRLVDVSTGKSNVRVDEDL